MESINFSDAKKKQNNEYFEAVEKQFNLTPA